MKKLIALSILFLAGCVGSQMTKGLSGLTGQDIHIAIVYLGYPDGERNVMGDHLYIWSTNHSGLMPVTSLATTNGSIGGTPYYSTSTAMSFQQMQFVCTIELAVNSSNIITHWQYQGNNAGCRQYASRFP